MVRSRYPRSGTRKGMVLLMAALFLLGVLAAMSVTLDVTRVLVARSEAQGRVEAGALAAVLELDGTRAGVERARRAVESGLAVEFAGTRNGPWEESPDGPERAGLVRVRMEQALPLIVLEDTAVRVEAVAEQRALSTLRNGLFPYTVSAEKLAEGVVCPDYVEAVSRSAIRQSVLTGFQTEARSLGDRIRLTGGHKELEREALAERVAQDSDTVSAAYADYAGNGRRIVAMPVHEDMRIVRFGAFLLQTAEPYCAEYIGPYMQAGRRKASAGESGYYVAALVR
jgi:hypothetical protein